MKAGLWRCGKACRLRWMNYLRPDIKRGHISADEEEMILRLHKLLGNRWSLIAGRIPGRTDNEIKNYWNSHLRKRPEAIEIQIAHKQPSSQDNNDSPISHIEETAHSLLGTQEVYNARSYAFPDTVEPMQSFNQISDGYYAFTAIDDFSNIISDVGGAPWSYEDSHSPTMAMPCNLPPLLIPPMGITAGYDNIIENISNAEHLAGSESNMQLCSALLRAECDIQIPSCRDEIDDALAINYDNAVEPMQNFKQISDYYGALTAINDFSIVLDNMGGVPWCYGDHLFSSMALPCNSPTPFISTTGTPAGYENITENINNAKHLVGSQTNMQLPSTLLRAECDIQIPSWGEEIDNALTVDYNNMGKAENGKNMYANSSTTIAEWWETFAPLSDWLDAPSNYILSIEDYY